MPLTPDEITAHARRIIVDAVEDIDYVGIGEMLEDAEELEGVSDEEYDEAQRAVDKAIRSAKITVSWQPDRGEDV